MKKTAVQTKTNKHLKNFFSLIIWVLLVQLFNSCTSTQTLQDQKIVQSAKNEKNQFPPLDIKKINSLQQINQLTNEGISHQVSIAPNGLKIIYISEKKTKHEHTQIYEMDLKTKSEKRLTYQDGFLNDPIFLNENEIAYASSTDEIKENPLNTKKDDPSLLEIYLSDRLGNQIERLTKRTGFDGQVSYSPHLSQFIYYVVKKDNKSWIQRIDRTTNESVVYLQSENDLLSTPKFSPNGSQLAWLSQNQKNQKLTLQFGNLTSNHLVLKKSIAYFDLPLQSINNLSWADDQKGIWLTGTVQNFNYSQIFYYSIAENCLKQVSQESIDVRDFQDVPFSQQLVIFTLGNENNSQIFTAQRPDLSTIKCLENQNSSLQ